MEALKSSSTGIVKDSLGNYYLQTIIAESGESYFAKITKDKAIKFSQIEEISIDDWEEKIERKSHYLL